MKVLNTVDTIVTLVCLSILGCGKASSEIPAISMNPPAAEAPNTQVPNTSVKKSDDTTDDGDQTITGPTIISLDYFQLTKTILTSFSGGVVSSVDGTANCAAYQNKTYCWDDGTQNLNGSSVQYWGIDDNFEVCPNIHGGCNSDLMTVPTLMSAGLIAKLNTVVGSAHRTVIEVMTQGTPSHADCTEIPKGLDCGTFIIDTTQNPL